MSNTDLTSRIPTTPEVHADLRDMKDDREDVNTYDELLRELMESSG